MGECIHSRGMGIMCIRCTNEHAQRAEVAEAWGALGRGPGEDDAGCVETLAQAIRAELKQRDAITVAFIRDYRDQYLRSNGSYAALHSLAELFEAGEHLEAFNHGELDDLVPVVLRTREGSKGDE